MRPIEFEILLALADGARHGYAIIQDIEARRGESVETGTLYRALQRLVEQSLVAPADAPAGEASDDERRRYYAITRTGRQHASTEARRMATLVDGARAARLLAGGV